VAERPEIVAVRGEEIEFRRLTTMQGDPFPR
jgi:hypothetical protein